MRMNNRFGWKRASTSVALATLVFHPYPVLAQASDAPFTLDPLIVTGERSEQQLEQVYQGTSIVTEESPEIRKAGADLNEVTRKTPNAFVQGPSELPTIRGIQGGGAGGLNSAAITGAPSRFPLIVDGVARIPSLVNRSFTSLWDVEQVEILRGPQSLLRGRTGIAGAAIINTYDPTRWFESAIQAGVEVNEINDPQYTLNAMVSGPLSDNLTGRATLELADGHDPRKVIGGDAPFITEYDQIRFRSKLAGSLGARTGWMLLAEHDRGQVPQTRNFVDDPALTSSPYKDRKIRANSPTRAFDSKASLLALKTETAMGANRFETITSWSRDEFDPASEQTFPSFLAGDERLLTFDGIYHFGPADGVTAYELAGLVGIGFEDRKQVFDATGAPLQADIDVDANTFGAYTDLRYGLTDTLTLLAGLRLQEYRDDRSINTTALLPPPVGPQVGASDSEENEFILLPKLGIGWQVNDTNTLGASVRRGYTPGGAAVNAFSATAYEYETETVWTTELTWRSRPSATLRTGLTLFHNDFTDPQVYGEVVPGNRLSLQVFNQDQGESYGAEFDLNWQATEVLELLAAVGLLETEITEANSARPDVEGNEFGQDPSLTATLGLEWLVAPGVTLDARTTYVGEAYNDFNNTSGSEIGDYTLTDIGATWTLQSAELRLYANNLFNETGLTGRVSGTGAFVTDPRELGLTATVFF